MQKFIQYTPTEILFGENTQAEVGKEVKKWGGSRVFIVYGGCLLYTSSEWIMNMS